MRGPEQLGPYTLCQPEGVFPLGEDALALGSFATVKRGWRVCDLGTGSGCLLLLLAVRGEELRLSGVDRDPRRRPGGPGQPGPQRPVRGDLDGGLEGGPLRPGLL